MKDELKVSVKKLTGWLRSRGVKRDCENDGKCWEKIDFADDVVTKVEEFAAGKTEVDFHALAAAALHWESGKHCESCGAWKVGFNFHEDVGEYGSSGSEMEKFAEADEKEEVLKEGVYERVLAATDVKKLTAWLLDRRAEEQCVNDRVCFHRIDFTEDVVAAIRECAAGREAVPFSELEDFLDDRGVEGACDNCGAWNSVSNPNEFITNFPDDMEDLEKMEGKEDASPPPTHDVEADGKTDTKTEAPPPPAERDDAGKGTDADSDLDEAASGLKLLAALTPLMAGGLRFGQAVDHIFRVAGKPPESMPWVGNVELEREFGRATVAAVEKTAETILGGLVDAIEIDMAEDGEEDDDGDCDVDDETVDAIGEAFKKFETDGPDGPWKSPWKVDAAFDRDRAASGLKLVSRLTTWMAGGMRFGQAVHNMFRVSGTPLKSMSSVENVDLEVRCRAAAKMFNGSLDVAAANMKMAERLFKSLKFGGEDEEDDE